MRIWRFEFGNWKMAKGAYLPWFEYNDCACGCKIVSIGTFYLTFLMNECYTKVKEE